jgi:hypothetical protein
MAKELCVIHANCQGEPLLKRLNRSPDFAQRFETRIVTNYTREPMPDGLLEHASLFLYQYLGDPWGPLASQTLLKRLADNARSLCIPNMFFLGYWPMWSGAPGFDYRDRRLDQLLDAGIPDEQILTLYLRSHPAKHFGLNDLLEETFRREQAREAVTPIKYLGHIREHWRTRRLFNTVNHPGAELMDISACGILDHLAMARPTEAALDQCGDPFPEFQQPIHPLVAEHFGLAFTNAETLYEVYGQKMTFARYVAHYIDCRRNGIDDFISYLRARAANAQA